MNRVFGKPRGDQRMERRPIQRKFHQIEVEVPGRIRDAGSVR